MSKISFGVIVLNGEPFTRYCLRSIYPFAHEIIVVEGAATSAAGIATPDGHSSDGTLEVLREFKSNHDPDDKLRIITAEDEGHPNGFWPGEKDEQSKAYAKRATGDYLWQVDIDEFYRREDMEAVISMLDEDPEITAVSFKMITFWGGLDYIADGWYLRRGAEIYHRLFKWGESYQYAAHRPPTVLDSDGRDLRKIKWVKGQELAGKGIFLYHYSLLFPKQVIEKCTYYQAASWAKRKKALEWAENVFFQLKNPFRVHNVYDYPSWLKRYEGEHPAEIQSLMADVRSGALQVELRPTGDIERLLRSTRYKLGREVVERLDYFARPHYDMRTVAAKAFNRTKVVLRHMLHVLGWKKKSTI